MSRLLVAALATAAFGLAACGSEPAATPSQPSSTPPPSASAAPQANGRLVVTYAEPADESEALWREIFKVGGLNGVADGLSIRFNLPSDIEIRVVSGFVGPNYNPSKRTITLSYGFVDYEARVFKAANPAMPDDELGRRLAELNAFILMHELGHAFVDVFELPITGKEEDAVDGLATAFLTEFVDGGDQMAFESAEFFNLLAKDPALLQESDFWDEHSLDKVRAYQIVCWVAGSSEEAYQTVANLGILGPERLQRCPAEHEQNVTSWFKLLKPHLRSS
jgi:hypothetical protein